MKYKEITYDGSELPLVEYIDSDVVLLGNVHSLKTKKHGNMGPFIKAVKDADHLISEGSKNLPRVRKKTAILKHLKHSHGIGFTANRCTFLKTMQIFLPY